MLTPAATVAQTFIRNQPWHASLTPGQQARLMEQLTFVKGEKGDCLLPAGATVKGWYAVLDGLVELQSTCETPLCCVCPGPSSRPSRNRTCPSTATSWRTLTGASARPWH